jgi:hypothetical protein
MGLHIFIQVSKILILLLTFTGNYVQSFTIAETELEVLKWNGNSHNKQE